MANPNAFILRAEQIAANLHSFSHPWNPNSKLSGTQLGRKVGLQRTGVNFIRVPPSKESFIYHSHHREEEWIFILSGNGIAEIDDVEFEVGAGDFMEFPTLSVAHHLRNTGNEDLVYLAGGENLDVEIADFPRLKKRLLKTAIDTHLITSHFALPLLIQKPGGLVVEVTDGTADYNQQNYRLSLFYDLAKTSIIRMAWGLAQELRPYQGTAVALTPGWLRSELMLDHFDVSEANWQEATAKEPHFVISETPRFIGQAVARLAGDPRVDRWNGQSLSSGQLAQIYGFTDVDGSQPDAWRYIQEVEAMGKPADATGYR